MIDRIICLLFGYFFGCFSTGYFVGKWYHIDLRSYGSGNAGTTNALRTLGWKAAAWTFLGDACKAIIPVFLVGFYTQREPLLLLYTGLGVVLGHNFPVWLRFKGGKGIAATAGVMLAFDWRVGLVAYIAFLLVVLVTRYVSLGSLLMAVTFPISCLVWYTGQMEIFLLGIVFVLLAIIKHSANIKRLCTGTEHKLGEKVVSKNIKEMEQK